MNASLAPARQAASNPQQLARRLIKNPRLLKKVVQGLATKIFCVAPESGSDASVRAKADQEFAGGGGQFANALTTMVPAANPPTTPAATSQPPAWALETNASASGSSPSVRQFHFASPGVARHVGRH